MQALLSDNEALVLFAVADKESYVFAMTRDRVDWRSLSSGRGRPIAKGCGVPPRLDIGKASDASAKVRAVRSGAANDSMARCLAPFEALVKDKPSLLVVPSGAADGAARVHLLVTEEAGSPIRINRRLSEAAVAA